MVLIWLADGFDEERQQRRAARELVDEDAFVRGVRAFADRAKAIERGNAERGREVSVGAAAGAGFGNSDAQRLARLLRQRVKPSDALRALHRRTVHPAGDLKAAVLVFWLQPAELLLYVRRIVHALDADV